MPPKFSLRKNIIPFFLSRQNITGFIVFYCFLSVLYRETSCPIPQQFSVFWFEILMYSFRDNAKFIGTSFPWSFCPLNFFPNVHDQGIDFRRKSVLFIIFPEQKSSRSVLSYQENMSLPPHCRKDHLFKQSSHLLLRDTIRTKFTQQFCLFHTYGDVYAPLITFMGTWISSKFIILISNSDSNSTKSKDRRFSVSNLGGSSWST